MFTILSIRNRSVLIIFSDTMCLPDYLHQVCIHVLFLFVINGVFGEDLTVHDKDKRLVMHMDGDPAIGF